MACEELKKSRKEQLKVLSVFRNKKKSQGTTRYNNDIQKTIKLLEQIDRDIIKCQEKEKSKTGKGKVEKVKALKLNPINPTLLDSPVAEESHSTGTR